MTVPISPFPKLRTGRAIAVQIASCILEIILELCFISGLVLQAWDTAGTQDTHPALVEPTAPSGRQMHGA